MPQRIDAVDERLIASRRMLDEACDELLDVALFAVSDRYYCCRDAYPIAGSHSSANDFGRQYAKAL